MTALEYMFQQYKKHNINLTQALVRNATQDEIQGIENKIGYYSEAVVALMEKEQKNERGC